MDVFNALASIPAIGPLLPYLLLAGVICAALSTALPPPTGSVTFMGRLYVILYTSVNWIGLNLGHAKNASAPDAAKPPAGTVSAIVALLAFGLVLTACTPGVKQTASSLATEAAPIAASVAVANASAPQLADLQVLCDGADIATAGASIALYGKPAATTASQVAAPLDSFCAIVKQGKVPANADSNSVPWGKVIISTIDTVAALANG